MLSRLILLWLVVILSAFVCTSGLKSQSTDPVKIGLLIQNKSSLAAKQGAELAVKMANKRGGLNGRAFQLVVKSMEGPWGTGSKQAVDLIWEDEVCALIGSHDGRNAHLVEQAATKSIVVFISAWSSDPTLSQAFVPWFFNCVPNDKQQADALVNEIYGKRKLSGIAVISDNAYDSNLASKNFMMSLKEARKPQPVQYRYEDYASRMDELADQISKKNVKAITLFCSPSASLKLIRLFKKHRLQLPVFGPISVLDENALSQVELQECSSSLLVPRIQVTENKKTVFQQEYQGCMVKHPVWLLHMPLMLPTHLLKRYESQETRIVKNCSGPCIQFIMKESPERFISMKKGIAKVFWRFHHFLSNDLG